MPVTDAIEYAHYRLAAACGPAVHPLLAAADFHCGSIESIETEVHNNLLKSKVV